MKKIKEFLNDTKANTIMMLVFMAVGILILIVIVTLVPGVASSVQTGLAIPATGDLDELAWNGSQTAFTNGSEMWAQLSPMISTTALVAVVGVLIGVLLLALSFKNR